MTWLLQLLQLLLLLLQPRDVAVVHVARVVQCHNEHTMPIKPGEKLMLHQPQVLVDVGVVHGALLICLLARHAQHEADGAHGRAMCRSALWSVMFGGCRWLPSTLPCPRCGSATCWPWTTWASW